MKKLFLSISLLLVSHALNAVSFDLSCDIQDKHIERHIQGDASSYTIEQDGVRLSVDVTGVDKILFEFTVVYKDESYPSNLVIDAHDPKPAMMKSARIQNGLEIIDRKISITNFKK